MQVGDDRKPFSSVGKPEIQLRPAASDAVGYQLININDNETSSGGRGGDDGVGEPNSPQGVSGVNQSPSQSVDLAPTIPPKLAISTQSFTSALHNSPADDVNVSSRTTAAHGRQMHVNTTVSKSRLRLKTAVKIDEACHTVTESINDDTEQAASSELSELMNTSQTTTEGSVYNESRKLSLLLTISGESRLRYSSLDRSADMRTDVFTISGSGEQFVDQSPLTTELPEVNNTTGSAVENRTDVWNAEEPSNSTRSVGVRYVHTKLSEDGDEATRSRLRPSEMASITAVSAVSLLLLVAVAAFAAYRRRRTCCGGRSRAVCGNGRKAAAADEKLKALRRVAAESETLSPNLLDQIIRAELARGRAKRYRARLRDGDDREQLERLAVELSDDWGTPPPSYRRLTPALSGPTHRRGPFWPGAADSPARVHDLPPAPPPPPPPRDLPPPRPEKSSASCTSVPLDFRQFRRRPLPEPPQHERTDQFELTADSFTPQLSDMRTGLGGGVRPPSDVTAAPAASPRLVCDVIRSPLPVSGRVPDGSEKRRRFPKMGRSCLLESLRQRGDAVDAYLLSGQCPPLPAQGHGARFHASQSAEDATVSPQSYAADLCHSAMTSWTRDLSHLPIPRDTTV